MLLCPACSTANPDTGRVCRTCSSPLPAPSPASLTPTVATPGPPRVSTSGGDDEGRFSTGALVAERYRIIALLGRGGMGEVYRANDLRLGQQVALKFLPRVTATDARALARFHQEVRIARQVSHPNVCRVYDIGDVDGAPFLSMEYIDGEDLASLLRRIGRLPADKALDIARRLCGGLAAAHEKGVLHRDLKPANIMIDGRGQVRITDFGLAAVAGELDAAEIRHGTPAYMAPEQLAGREVTVRSDLYALGLVLYELFSGRRAFEAASLAELVRMQEDSAPASLTSVVKDLDPAVERVVLRCLAADPRNRPASALTVAAALPGGDPLAAAVAAGETPSPEMVAAAGECEVTRPAVAITMLAVAAGALLATALLSGRVGIVSHTPFDLSHEALATLSGETAKRLGYTGRPADFAYGFNIVNEYLDYMRDNRQPEKRWAYLASGRPAPISFWYRGSPRGLYPGRDLTISMSKPPFEVSGMVRLELDTQGRLIRFEAVPPQLTADTGPPPEPDWNPLFAAAGLDPAPWKPATPQWTPVVAFDARAAWTGAFPEAPDIPVRIEAAAWRGKPVHFQYVFPWMRPDRMQEKPESAGDRATQVIYFGVLGAMLSVAAVLARRNIALNRGDRRGAARLAGFFLVAHLLHAVCYMKHVPHLGEVELLVQAAGRAMFSAALMWVLYLALEPYVRSRWPQTLVSWSRLLVGKFRDPRVGADILIGVLVGLAWSLLFCGANVIVMGLGAVPMQNWPGHLMGVRAFLTNLLGEATGGSMFALGCFFLVFLLRVLLRKGWLAAAAFVALFTGLKMLESTYPAVELPVYAATYAVVVAVLLRFGLVPLIVAAVVVDTLLGQPLTIDASAWFFGTSLAAMLFVFGLAAFGFRAATAGRTLLGDDVLSR